MSVILVLSRRISLRISLYFTCYRQANRLSLSLSILAASLSCTHSYRVLAITFIQSQQPVLWKWFSMVVAWLQSQSPDCLS
jgi:hypothetical protein